MAPHAQRGFTLLEVLVAVAVLAVAMGALIKGGAEAAANTYYLRDRTIAHWVAMNRIAEMQLDALWPDTGTTKGKTEMANRTWRWEAKVSDTFDRDVRRLDVSVLPEEEDASPLARLSAFIGRPPV